jgi:hypothetical protein
MAQVKGMDEENLGSAVAATAARMFGPF